MDNFEENDLVYLSNIRKLDKIFSNIELVHRTSCANPSKFRYGLILRNKNGDRVYFKGDVRRKEFIFSYHDETHPIQNSIELANEMDFDFVFEYVKKWRSKPLN
jgi:cytidine deaminase